MTRRWTTQTRYTLQRNRCAFLDLALFLQQNSCCASAKVKQRISIDSVTKIIIVLYKVMIFSRLLILINPFSAKFKSLYQLHAQNLNRQGEKVSTSSCSVRLCSEYSPYVNSVGLVTERLQTPRD